MRGPTNVKFCTMGSTWHYFIVPVQNFKGRTLKTFQGPKTCKIWPDFGRLRSSAANISETDKNIQNLIYRDSSCVRRNKSGEVWSIDLEDLDVKSYPPKAHILKKNILRAKIFTRARESPSLTSALPTGNGGPPYNFFKRGAKIGLKCNKLALITLELGGVARRNFGT